MTGQHAVARALEKGKPSLLIILYSACIYIYIYVVHVMLCLPYPNDLCNRIRNSGYIVRLLYRTEATIPDSFKDKVELINGDVTNVADVEKTLEGTDCVCIILGTRNVLTPTTVLSTGTNNIIAAMKRASIRRFSVCLSSFLFWEPEKVPKQFEHLNDEHKAMLAATKASGLDYIAILPPHIADEPVGPHKILHDQSPGRIISKYDLANFLIDSLDQSEHYGKVCGIAKV